MHMGKPRVYSFVANGETCLQMIANEFYNLCFSCTVCVEFMVGCIWFRREQTPEEERE